ncbi:Lrp/AsnC family transcriptional regulator [Candidatus Woesearchaeota archaeon]|nr:Lrp/AsnC family transcriptional regulator [Candidatus Woesearchaeota archaeon]
MIKDRDMQMLGFFRNNARMPLTDMSKKTKIPVSTLFDRLKEYEKRKLIMKHTSLLDYKMLGYDIKIQILITANKTQKESLRKFLEKHPQVNTLFRVNNGFDFMIEAIFQDISNFDEFTKQLEQYEIQDKKEFFIMEEMKREEFMTYKENIGIQR